jgi:transposase-like protein
MALAHGLNANLLRKWITAASTRRGSLTSVATVLLPVTTQSPTPASPSDGHLEVVLPGGTVRIRGSVSRDALQVVIDCLSRRP